MKTRQFVFVCIFARQCGLHSADSTIVPPAMIWWSGAKFGKCCSQTSELSQWPSRRQNMFINKFSRKDHTLTWKKNKCATSVFCWTAGTIPTSNKQKIKKCKKIKQRQKTNKQSIVKQTCLVCWCVPQTGMILLPCTILEQNKTRGSREYNTDAAQRPVMHNIDLLFCPTWPRSA